MLRILILPCIVSVLKIVTITCTSIKVILLSTENSADNSAVPYSLSVSARVYNTNVHGEVGPILHGVDQALF